MQNRIRELRKKYHMTQVRLAIELEVAQETVSAYENQRHYPSFTQLVRMSELFNASIDYIMGLSDIPPAAPCLSPDQQRLLGMTKQMNSYQLELLTTYAQGIIDSARQ